MIPAICPLAELSVTKEKNLREKTEEVFGDGASAQKPIIFSDFDGTITQLDVTDVILERFADPSWHEIEGRWLKGGIGSRECIERQAALVRVTMEQLDALIDAIPLDPDFPEFFQFVRDQQLPFYIVSDSFDYVIRRVLHRLGANGDLENGRHLFSTGLRIEKERLQVSFAHSEEGCEHGCATCKPEVIRNVREAYRPVIFVGDGLSDRFAVEEADIAFAKHELLTYCRQHNLLCRPFQTFGEVQKVVASLLQADDYGSTVAVDAAT